MAERLNTSVQIRTLARDLGLRPNDNPVQAILEFCRRRIVSVLKEAQCRTLSELLSVMATALETEIIEIESDDALRELIERMRQRKELGFAGLFERLANPKLFAVTIRLLNPDPGDRQYVSIIDCRGEKKFRRYFSKWHELAHLVTLTNQQRLVFCRSHENYVERDPEEQMMDLIAGDAGFFAGIVQSHGKGDLSFDRIEILRDELCPEASLQASLIGFTKAWPSPCILLTADLAYKKEVERSLNQPTLDFVPPPEQQLRVVHVTTNDLASEKGVHIFPNMRIPESSVIFDVFMGEVPSREADENLKSWCTSDGYTLLPLAVQVYARRIAGTLYALINIRG